MNEILVDVGVTETRLAITENKELVELYIERKNSKRIVGNIYKGRVINVLPGMQAAFVDIGLEKNSFLYIKDALPQDQYGGETEAFKDVSISDILKVGQEVIVQVIKEPIGTKGARVTTHITLPGRYLVLMPYTDYVGVSRRINGEEERERLRKEIEEIKPSRVGIIVRTVAKGKNKEDFQDDIKFLLRLWQKIDREKKIGFAPRLIHRDFDLINKYIRDIFTKDINAFYINDIEEYKNAKELIELISPSLKERLFFFNEDIEIFEKYNLEGQISKGLARKIWLKSGGYIVIDITEALTVIDVNTGKYVGGIDLEDTVYKTNLEAAHEIAKQLRLRDIGGIIIVDFIDMTNEDYINDVLVSLEKALSKDRTKTKILGITQLGLVEITRKKVRQQLDFQLQKRCGFCDGTGRIPSEFIIIHKIEKQLRRIKNHTICDGVVFELHPSIKADILKERHLITEMEKLVGIEVIFVYSEGIPYGELKLKQMGSIDTIKKEYLNSL